MDPPGSPSRPPKMERSYSYPNSTSSAKFRTGILAKAEELSQVMEMDWPKDSIGDVLQLVEFLKAFAKPLDLKPGETQNVLKEITRGSIIRCGGQSALAHLHFRLLSALCTAGHIVGRVTLAASGKDSWFQVLSRHLSSHWCAPPGWSSPQGIKSQQHALVNGNAEEMSSEGKHDEATENVLEQTDDISTISRLLASGASGYADLQPQQKLALLNMLCHDVLDTDIFREHLEKAAQEQNEKQKEDKTEAALARKGAKDRGSEINSALRRATRPDSVLLLSLEEQRVLMARCRGKAIPASSRLEAAKKFCDKQSSQCASAIRTQPVFISKDGRMFWRLEGARERSEILLQEIDGSSESGTDTWACFPCHLEPHLKLYFSSHIEKSTKKMKFSSNTKALVLQSVN